MPRGIYDRSKLKKNKTESTETVAKVAAPKGKPGRKPGRKPGSTATTQAKAETSGRNTLELMSEVRQNLAILSSLKQVGFSIPAITSEVQAHVDILGKLSREAFGVEEETEAKPATAASNGVSTSTIQPMPSVPLPPNTTVTLPTQS
jgi:hypothetical protein